MFETEVVPFEKIKSLFAAKRIVKVGDIGVYRDVLSVNTSNEDTHPLKYDIFAKVKAVAIYSNLVEIEVIDITTLNSCNDNIKNVISANIPKYIKSRQIKWEGR